MEESRRCSNTRCKRPARLGLKLCEECARVRAIYKRTPGGKVANARYKRTPWGRAADTRYKQTPGGKIVQVRYERSLKGVATQLKKMHRWKGSGLDCAVWAELLMNPMSRCHICGIRNNIREVYRVSGPWFKFMGDPRKRRLELGHRVPNDNAGGCIPLCGHCNRVMGDRILTLAVAEEVLRQVRADWDRVEKPALLWWLHTEINSVTLGGIRGRASMSPAKERRNERMQEALDERSQGVR